MKAYPGRVNANELYELVEETWESLQRYIDQGIPTGGFLRACLENDFSNACDRADLVNRYHLVSLAAYIVHEMPDQCWGSRAAVDAWIEAGKQKRRASQ